MTYTEAYDKIEKQLNNVALEGLDKVFQHSQDRGYLLSRHACTLVALSELRIQLVEHGGMAVLIAGIDKILQD
jgi:hypothetical protein